MKQGESAPRMGLSQSLRAARGGQPHGGVRPFHQKSNCLTQSTLGPYVVYIWSRNTPEYGASKTLVLHRVDVQWFRGGLVCEAHRLVYRSA